MKTKTRIMSAGLNLSQATSLGFDKSCGGLMKAVDSHKKILLVNKHNLQTLKFPDFTDSAPQVIAIKGGTHAQELKTKSRSRSVH